MEAIELWKDEFAVAIVLGACELRLRVVLPRIGKLEKDVDAIQDDVSCIKESVDRLSGVKNVDNNGDCDVDADSTHGKSQDEVISNVMEKDGELKKLTTEIVHDRKEIDETSEKLQEKENNANSL